MDIHRKLRVLEQQAKMRVLEQFRRQAGRVRQLRVLAQQPKLRVLEFGVGCHVTVQCTLEKSPEKCPIVRNIT